MWNTARKVAREKAQTSERIPNSPLEWTCQADPSPRSHIEAWTAQPKEAPSEAGGVNGNTGALQAPPNQGAALLEEAVACSQCGFGKLLLVHTVTQWITTRFPSNENLPRNLRRIIQSFDSYNQGYKATSQWELLPACQVSGTAWGWMSSCPLAGRAQSCSRVALLPDSPLFFMIQAPTQSRHWVRETS